MHQRQIDDAWRADGRPMRVGRAGLAALVCTVLAASSHLVAGGRASSAALTIVLLGIWMAAAVLTTRRLTTSQLVGFLLLGQVVTHVVSAPGSGSDSAMLAAHVVGTALSAVLLRRGEDALWTLADRIALRATSILSAVAPSPWRRAPVRVASTRTHRPVLLTHVIEGRGPPAGLA